MKRKIFFGIVAFAALAFGSCQNGPDGGEDSTGLAIKVYSPTKVLPGQVVTINGNRLDEVTSVVFPGDVTVTDITHLGNGQISVVTPEEVTAGELSVVADNETATARIPMTVGAPRFNTVSYIDNEAGPGAWITMELTITGVDLEFTKQAIFPGEDGDVVVEALEFVRKANNMLKIKVPEGIAAGEGKVGLVACNGTKIETTDVLFVNKVPGGGGGISWVVAWEGEEDPGPQPAFPATLFVDAIPGSIVRISYEFISADWGKIEYGDWGGTIMEFTPSEDGVVEFELTEDMLNKMRNPAWGDGGILLHGVGYIITKIEYSVAASSEIVAWEGEVNGNTSAWSAVAIPNAAFAETTAGAIIRFYIRDNGAEPILQPNYGDWTGVVVELRPGTDAEFAEFTVTEDQLNKMMNPGYGDAAFQLMCAGCVIYKITYEN